MPKIRSYTSGRGPEPIAGPYPPPALAKAGVAPGSAPFAPLRQVERAGDGPRIGVPRFREDRPGRRYEDAIFL